MNHEPFCLVMLNLTVPCPAEDDSGLVELLSFTSWCVGPNPGFAVAWWKKRSKALAPYLTDTLVITPSKKHEILSKEHNKEAKHHGTPPRLPKPRIEGKPAGVYEKEHYSKAGKIHLKIA